MASIIPLGTRGWIPLEGRETASVLIKENTNNFLLDCGTGLRRLLDPELYSRLHPGPIHIILSHYHLDHIVGLTWLRGIFDMDNRDIHIYGPGNKLVKSSLISAMKTLFGEPLFGEEFESFSKRISLHEVNKRAFKIDSNDIELFPLRHQGGSVAIKINNKISYITDTCYFKDISNFVKNSQVLLCEVDSLIEKTIENRHCSIVDTANIANQAKVKSLIPIHFGCYMKEEDISLIQNKIDKESACNFSIIIPSEGKEIFLGNTP